MCCQLSQIHWVQDSYTMTNMSSSSHSQMLPLISNSDHDVQMQQHPNKIKVRSVLPFFCFINMTMSCGTTIYRAYNHNDTPMIVFITIVYFGSFLLDYWSRLYQKLSPLQASKRRNLKIGTWVLLSGILLGFAAEFSTFMSLIGSICMFGIVIAINALVFYAYFILECDKCSSVCSTRYSCCNDDSDKNVAQHKEGYEPLTGEMGWDNVWIVTKWWTSFSCWNSSFEANLGGLVWIQRNVIYFVTKVFKCDHSRGCSYSRFLISIL